MTKCYRLCLGLLLAQNFITLAVSLISPAYILIKFAKYVQIVKGSCHSLRKLFLNIAASLFFTFNWVVQHWLKYFETFSRFGMLHSHTKCKET